MSMRTAFFSNIAVMFAPLTRILASAFRKSCEGERRRRAEFIKEQIRAAENLPRPVARGVEIRLRRG